MDRVNTVAVISVEPSRTVAVMGVDVRTVTVLIRSPEKNRISFPINPIVPVKILPINLDMIPVNPRLAANNLLVCFWITPEKVRAAVKVIRISGVISSVNNTPIKDTIALKIF